MTYILLTDYPEYEYGDFQPNVKYEDDDEKKYRPPEFERENGQGYNEVGEYDDHHY